MSIQNDVKQQLSFDGYREEDFFILIAMMETINEGGTSWEDIMHLCLLGSAICANNQDMTPDEYMVVLRGIKVTEEGFHGDA